MTIAKCLRPTVCYDCDWSRNWSSYDDRLVQFRVTRDLVVTRSGSRFVLSFVCNLSLCVHTCDRVLLEVGERGAVQGAVGPSRDHVPLGSSPAPAEIGGYLLLLSARAPYMLLFEYAETYFIVSLIIYRAYIFNTDTVIHSLFVTRNTHTLFASRLAFYHCCLVIQNEWTLGCLQ